MKRYRIGFAVIGVIAIPAVAAACWPMWGRSAYRPMYAAPMYAAPAYTTPMYGYGAPVYGAPMCDPMPYYAGPSIQRPTAPARVLPPPRVETAPKTALPTPAPGTGMGSAIPEPMPPAAIPMRAPDPDLVRPTGGSDAAPKPADSSVAAPQPRDTPAAHSKAPGLDYPKVEIPKNLRPDPKIPPLELPKQPDALAVPKVPAVGAAKDMLIPAIPSAAPASGSEPLIPPPSLPVLPDPTKRDPLPSLTLPPEVPVAPEKKSDSTSRSSPLTRGGTSGIKVKVFPAKVVVDQETGYRSVGFYNHTARDLELTIEGRAVKLPARSYLYAQLGAAFTWSIGNRPAARERVPEDAGGLEVVFGD